MRGCVLVGKVVFEDNLVPSPTWPDRSEGELPARAIPRPRAGER
jgi:hypothetical protein